MEAIDFKSIYVKMAAKGPAISRPVNLKVPGAAAALHNVMEFFLGREFVWLPEYDAVAGWLEDNRGRGLCLYGTNGTGKTILVQKAIPLLLLKYCGRIVRCFNYYDLTPNADKILDLRLLSIDDVGMENESAIYGNRRWIFPEVMDLAEKRNNVVIFSSNLDGKGFCERYGIRTFERIVATTKRVEFTHKSLRK